MPLPLRKLIDCRTDRDLWSYYAEVYAWRIVRGYGSRDDRVCPLDPKGEWFDEALIDDAVARFRRIIAAERRAHEEGESCDPDVQAQNQHYARASAYRTGTLDEYDAQRHPERWAARQRERYRQGQREADARGCPISDVLAALGISATEVSPPQPPQHVSHSIPQPEMSLELQE